MDIYILSEENSGMEIYLLSANAGDSFPKSYVEKV